MGTCDFLSREPTDRCPSLREWIVKTRASWFEHGARKQVVVTLSNKGMESLRFISPERSTLDFPTRHCTCAGAPSLTLKAIAGLYTKEEARLMRKCSNVQCSRTHDLDNDLAEVSDSRGRITALPLFENEPDRLYINKCVITVIIKWLGLIWPDQQPP